MPYCTSCGSEATDEMLFCPQCGSKLIIPKGGFKRDKIRDSTVEAEEKAEPENIPDRAIKRGKLYKQWVAYSGLPAGEIQSTKTSRRTAVAGQRSSRSPALLYMLLGFFIGILLMALVFLLYTAYF